MLKFGSNVPGREVYIEGRRYMSATVAAQVLELPLPTLYARLHSPTPRWAQWRYNDGKETTWRIQVSKPAPVEWVVYTLTHIPTGQVYVGMTRNYPARKSQHKHHLMLGTHRTHLLQVLFKQDSDWENWKWDGFIVADKEEATLVEQQFIDKYNDRGLLLNTSLIGRAPIEYLMTLEENREKRREGNRRYLEANPGTAAERGRKGSELRWADRSARRAWEGAGNPFAKRVQVDGVVYGSVKDAQRALGINEKTIRTRARDPQWPTYTFDIPAA
jgi:hypothetical protein